MNNIKKNFLIYISIPVFIMTLLILPLIFVLVKRYYTGEIVEFSFANGIIMTTGILLNIFIYKQLQNSVKHKYIYTLIVLTSLGFTIGSLIYTLFNHSLFFLYGWSVLLSYILIYFILLLSLSITSTIYLSYQKLIIIDREKIAKEIKLREEMERQIYSSKINPHFLFNSLNLMVSLLEDKERAESVLIDLSDLLRYNIEASKKSLISVNEEISNVKKYLNIQKERFGSRIDYELVNSFDFNIPPLILQPIVENSIKHNMDSSDYIYITILVKKEFDELIIDIFDSFRLLKEQMIGQGTGLELTRKRIELSGGKLHIINGGVKICLPIR